MNTPNDPLEEELRGLQPATPSLRLASRIAADLAEPSTSAAATPARRQAVVRTASLWLSWGIAAAMTVAYFTRTPASPSVSAGQAEPAVSETAARTSTSVADAPARFKPVSTTNTLINALDEGVVFLEDGQPARKVRYEFLDTVDLRSTDDSRATIAVTTPREEIRLVPVQTF